MELGAICTCDYFQLLLTTHLEFFLSLTSEGLGISDLALVFPPVGLVDERFNGRGRNNRAPPGDGDVKSPNLMGQRTPHTTYSTRSLIYSVPGRGCLDANRVLTNRRRNC